MKQFFTLLICFCILTFIAKAQLVLSENFTGFTNGNLGTQNAWVSFSNDAPQIQVSTTTSLIYPDYEGDGPYISVAPFVAGTGRSNYKYFSQPVTGNTTAGAPTRTIYYSFLVRVADATTSQANANYSIALRRGAGITEAESNGRFSINKDASGNWLFRIAAGTTQSAPYNTGTTSVSQVFHILMRYDMVSNASDTAYMWVNPTLSGEPSKSSATLTSISNENAYGNQLDALMVFQRNTSTRPTAQFDGFKVSAGTNATTAFYGLGIAGNPCVTPGAQPTGLTFSNITASSSTLTFVASSPVADDYLVIRTSGTVPSAPVNGTHYTPGAAALGGVIESSGSSTIVNSTGLNASSSYNYYVYAYNVACLGGPLYYTAGPLNNFVTTANAPRLIDENFTGYTNGDLGGQGTWAVYNSGADPQIKVNNTSALTYGNYPADGPYVSVVPFAAGTGRSHYKPFTSAVSGNTTNGAPNHTIYYSFLVRVSDASTIQDNANYSVSLRVSGGTLEAESNGRFAINKDGTGNWQFRIAAGTTQSAPYSTGSSSTSQVFLILMRYDMVSNASDTAYMWVNPTLAGEPDRATANLVSVSNENSYGNLLSALMIFQRSSTSRPAADFDGFRVAASTNSTAAFASLDISSALSACVSPLSQPGSLSFTNVSGSSMTVNFAASAPAADKYLVVRTTGGLASFPVDGTSYAPGMSALGGVILSAGNSLVVASSSLASNTSYRYVVYAYNDINCTGGPLYNVVSPLDGTQSTNSNTSLTRKLAIVGSSTSACTGPSVSDSCYVNRLIAYYAGVGNPITVDNLAVGGTDPFAANMTRAIQGSAGNNPPGVILINYPTNGFCAYTVTEIMARFRQMKQQANDAGIPAYITTTQPRENDCYDTDSMQLKLTQLKDSILLQFGTYAIDFYTTLADASDSTIANAYNSGDGVHLNNAGHRILFERVLAKDIFVSAVLPLKFLSFTGIAKGTANELNWKTAEESNLSHFDVQRSNNGRDFKTITTLLAGKQHGTGSYSYADRSATGATHYYRLAAEDIDGSITYTGIVLLEGTNLLKFRSIYTTNSFCKAEVESPGKQEGSIQLVSMAGQVISNKSILLEKGLNTITVNASGTGAGVYLIRVIAKSGTLTKKIFIQ